MRFVCRGKHADTKSFWTGLLVGWLITLDLSNHGVVPSSIGTYPRTDVFASEVKSARIILM